MLIYMIFTCSTRMPISNESAQVTSLIKCPYLQQYSPQILDLLTSRWLSFLFSLYSPIEVHFQIGTYNCILLCFFSSVYECFTPVRLFGDVSMRLWIYWWFPFIPLLNSSEPPSILIFPWWLQGTLKLFCLLY